MLSDRSRLHYLLTRYISGSIDSDESEELAAIVAELEDHAIYTAMERAAADAMVRSKPRLANELHYRRILQNPRLQTDPPRGVRSRGRRRVLYGWSVGAAAAVIIAVSLFIRGSGSDEEAKATSFVAAEIQPGRDKATLTLADGRTVTLDDLEGGRIAEEMGIRISKTDDGQIMYESVGEHTGIEQAYNRIQTPKGGEYRLVLPDGTKVWLNAASSLSYPMRFSDTSRTVQLVGEAFFEVVPMPTGNGQDKPLPFVVETPQQQVEVLGTQFNVNAYPDDGREKTTLLEGKVRVSARMEAASTHTLKPGDEARVPSGGSRITITQVDPNIAAAWKEGYFAFDNAHIKDVMRTLARWYDIELVYESDLGDAYFGGTISKFEQFDKLLEAIELTGVVRFCIAGRRVTVMT